MDNNLALMTIDDLLAELKNHCVAYVVTYQYNDEDVGPKRIILKNATFETYKTQILGLSSRLYWWLKRRSAFNATKSGCIYNNNSDDDVNEASAIVEELSSRCTAIVFACLRREDDKIFLHQKVNEHGQALGIAYELHEWVQSLSH